MGKQYLLPAKDTEDAGEALARVSQVAEPGDEIVLLVVSEIPEGEYVGDKPPAQVLDPLATTGGVSSEPRAAHDQPEFVGRESIMELQGQQIHEALDAKLAALHDRGYAARLDAVFSDDPDGTIQDYAGDLDVTAVYVTRNFHDQLNDETKDLARAL